MITGSFFSKKTNLHFDLSSELCQHESEEGPSFRFNCAFICICLYFEICLRSEEISLASLESVLISVTLSQGQL